MAPHRLYNLPEHGAAEKAGRSEKGACKKVEEIETTVGRPGELMRILKRLGLKRSFRYQKYRSLYYASLEDGRTLLAVLEETPVGNFLGLGGGAEVIQTVTSRIGARPEEYVTDRSIEAQLAQRAACELNRQDAKSTRLEGEPHQPRD